MDEYDGVIDDEREDEASEEDVSTDIDGTEQPADDPSYIVDPSTDEGDAGDIWPDVTPEDYDPLPAPSTVTVTVSTDEIIDDYSQESLAAYEAAGYTPVAVLDDGTERVVTWAEVFDPRPQPASQVYTIEADAIAKAVNQHFWSRSTDPESDGAGTGAFVTDDEQAAFLAAAAQGFPDLGDGTGDTKPWHNILMNSLGILLRSGLYDLASLTRSGIAFYDGEGNAASNVLASFGATGSQLGRDGEARLEMNYNNLALVDMNGNTFFKVEDLRGRDGYATVTETHDTGGRQFFDTAFVAQNIISCMVDGQSVGFRYSTQGSVTTVTLDEAAVLPVTVTYRTSSEMAKGFTFGRRNANGSVGAYSLVQGEGGTASGRSSSAFGNSTASGKFSHAEGSLTHASGYNSHAEGQDAIASGQASHAEGHYSQASGWGSHAEGIFAKAVGSGSHAQGTSTIALGESQTVIGRYNSVDQNDRYAFVIGNGGEYDDAFVDPDNPDYDYDDEYTHSNALTVDWDGNVACGEVNGLALQSMGEMVEESGTATVATSTNANVVSKQLQPGTWLVNARLQYPSNATGRRAAKLSTTSADSGNVISSDVRNAVSGGTTQVQTERVFAFDTATTIHLIAWQDSGSALTCSGQIQAVRISPAIGETYEGGGGGAGGTSDYADLLNKPAINGVTLSGDKSSSQLGLDFASSPTSGGNADKANAILYGAVDATSTSTAFTATVAGLDELVDGTCVVLKNGVVTSAAGFTIDVNGLGAKPVYTNLAAATAESTKFNVNYTMMFIYDSTRITGGAWLCYNGFDSNSNTIGYQLRTNNSTLPASDKGYRYRLWFTSADGTKWVPANTSTSTNATAARTLNQRPIDPFGPIAYNGQNATTDAGANLTTAYMWQQYTLTIGYSYMASGFSLMFPAPVYLKATPQADGSAVMESIVQALPSSADGKIYIFLGRAYSATAMELFADHPVYCFSNGALRKWTGQAVQAELTAGDHITISGNTISVDELTAAQTAALLD